MLSVRALSPRRSGDWLRLSILLGVVRRESSESGVEGREYAAAEAVRFVPGPRSRSLLWRCRSPGGVVRTGDFTLFPAARSSRSPPTAAISVSLDVLSTDDRVRPWRGPAHLVVDRKKAGSEGRFAFAGDAACGGSGSRLGLVLQDVVKGVRVRGATQTPEWR